MKKEFTIQDMTDFGEFCLQSKENEFSVGFLLIEFLNERKDDNSTNSIYSGKNKDAGKNGN